MVWTEFAVRLGIAFSLGCLIGLERQWRNRIAGLATNTLVSTGAALFVMVGLMLSGDSDPTRVVSQVVSGIGFIGGGVIFKEGISVRGLNTAATLWCAAAVGCLAGSGGTIEALIAVVAVVVANILLPPLAHVINRESIKSQELQTHYRCFIVCRSQDEAIVRAKILQTAGQASLLLQGLTSQDIDDSTNIEVKADFICSGRKDVELEQIVSRLSLESGVTAVSWKIMENS
ncbi:MAG: MgtC/SapB family protein [Calothrix sp. SM1_7_51]|nr:MgtC/SapB family protein [Calothrix sp. SM1_7_51]